MSREWRIKVVPADAVIIRRDYLPPEVPLRPDVEAAVRAYHERFAREWLKRRRRAT
jgi:hypothetical protein